MPEAGVDSVNYLQFIHFFCVVSYLYLAAYLVVKNHRSLLNLTCSAVILLFSLWSLSLVFVHDPSATREAAHLFYSIGSLAWASFASCVLWFIMVFVDNRKVLESRWFYVALAVPPVVVIYGQWAGHVAADYVLLPWGWAFVWSRSLWTYFFWLYYVVYMSRGLYLLARQMREAGDPTRRKQASIICHTAVLPLVLATATDVVLPSLGIHAVPNLAPDFTIIWAVGLVLAIAKYGMLEITPSAAAEKIISTMSDALLLLDEKGRIALANDAATRLLSYGRDELKGVGIGRLFPGRLGETQGKPLKANDDVVGRDYVLLTKTGDEIPVIFSSSVMKGTTGKIIGTVCVARDITERKRAEEAAKSYSTQLEAANEELRSFAYSVSHDLRAPLREVDGYSKALQEESGAELGDSARAYLDKMRAGTERMSRLVGGLLRLSRLAQSRMLREAVDLSAIAAGVIERLRRAEPGRDVEFVAKPGLAANGDAELLGVVLENLLGNAWKFTARKERARIEFGAEEADGEQSFFVRDNGAGFDMARAGGLFGPFQRLHSAEEFAGNGIGLATVQRIVRRHGGRAWAEGEPGKGATFRFTLG
jgi:PAS domain S-box-containing protein